MKKSINNLALIILPLIFFYSCKKEEAVVIPKLTYNADIKSILVANCTPCHLAGGVRANKWDDFATTKANVTQILDRIQRDVTATGFMPRGKSTPVPAADIAKITKWLGDGLLEN